MRGRPICAALVGGLPVCRDPGLGLVCRLASARQRSGGNNRAVLGAGWLRRFGLDFDMQCASRFPLAKLTLWARQEEEWHPVRMCLAWRPGHSLLVPPVHVAEDGDLGVFTGSFTGPFRCCRGRAKHTIHSICSICRINRGRPRERPPSPMTRRSECGSGHAR